jgi:uncharacterized DUF497 family protein
MVYEFEWDLKKARDNLLKHNCSFEQAMEVFADPNVIHLEDPWHSSEEDRFYAVGKTLKGEVLTVRYTWRGQKIRIYGAAKWRKWKRYYEENS